MLKTQLLDKTMVIEKLTDINTQLEELKKPQVSSYITKYSNSFDWTKPTENLTKVEELYQINRILVQELQAVQTQVTQLDLMTSTLHRENEMLKGKCLNVF